MKITSLLCLAGLVALSSRANAAPSRLEDDILVLPACVVEAPRAQPAVERVQASLSELAQHTTLQTEIRPQLSLLKVPAMRTEAMNRVLKDAKTMRLAKS